MRRQKLWDSYPRFVAGYRNGGPKGGIWPTRMVRPQSVSLGGVALPGALMVMHEPKSPWMGHADGYIGIHALRRLNMIFELDQRAMWIKPNKAIAEPYNYDRSGMEFRYSSHARQTAVTWIMPGGPADKAGIIVGDRLTAINSVEDRDLLDQPFRGAPGTTVPVKLERGGKRWAAQALVLLAFRCRARLVRQVQGAACCQAARRVQACWTR
ncbi:MAG: PDZ domain-containing protein [Pseudomonadota bacterium]